MTHSTKYRSIAYDILALLAGSLLPLAFSPVDLPWLAILPLILLIICWQQNTPLRAAWRGWLFGLGQFGVGVSWVFVSIHVYGNSPIILAIIITFLLVGALALCPALMGYLLIKLFRPMPLDSAHLQYSGTWLLVFPALWVLFEWLRSWLFTGFPWLLLGYSQTDTLLQAYLPLVGVYGVSYLLALLAALFYITLKRLRYRKISWITLLALIVICLAPLGLQQLSWVKVSGPSKTVSLVQGNISQDIKWMSQFLDESLLTYQRLTHQHWQSDVIIWPEAAIPLPRKNAQEFLESIEAYADATQTTLLTGIPVHAPRQGQYYNAVITLGSGDGEYYKRRLVPFGEYVPLEQWLRGLIDFFDLPMSNFISGPKEQPEIHFNGTAVGTFICYEIAYSSLVREAARDAELLVTVSNDAWFGDSFAPAQHLQIARARSQQVQREHLFATNDGITAIIRANGDIADALPQFTTAVLTGEVTPMSGLTPWTRWGDRPILLLTTLLLIIGIYRRRQYDYHH